MKPVAVLLALSVMLLGCYAQAPLLKHEWLPTDETAVFYLNDGSQIESGAGGHTRIDGGYEVSGSLTRPHGASEPFNGLLHDSDIQKVTTARVDVVRTSIATTLGAGALFVLVLAVGFALDGFHFHLSK